MTIKEAYNKGLIKVGVIVKTNASGDVISTNGYFTGVISHVHRSTFDIKRNDGTTGNGTNNDWYVEKSNNKASIQILPDDTCILCLKNKGEFKVEESYVCKECIFTVPECKHCGKLILNGEICPDCMDTLYEYCLDCGGSFLSEDMKDGYCKRCWDERIHCHECGKFERIDNMFKGSDKKLYCAPCFGLKYYICRDCHRVFPINDFHTVNNHPYKICKDCLGEFYRPCNKCNKTFHLNRLIKKGGQYLCETCHEQSKPRIKSLRANGVKLRQTRKILLDMTHETMKRFNYCNVDDDRLLDIVSEVGESTNPIYLYGLINRAEYSFSCSPTMIERLNPYMSEGFIETPNGKERLEVIDIGKPYSLGINMELRLNKFDWVCDFVKKLTNVTC